MIHERITRLCDAANAVLDFMGVKYIVPYERRVTPHNNLGEHWDKLLEEMRTSLHSLTPADTHPTVAYAIFHNDWLWGVSLKGELESINTMAIARSDHYDNTIYSLGPQATWDHYNQVNRWDLKRIGIV